MEITQRVAVVTGASGGLGGAISLRLAKEGAHVLMCDLASPGTDLTRQLSDEKLSHEYYQIDVSNEDEWEKLAVYLEKTFGGLDILVNNAGINRRLTIMQSPLREWQETFAVNLFGAALGTRSLAPLMRNRPLASIVNISSTSGLVGHPDAAYSATKWALRGLTKTAALEFADWGIRVNSVHPGSVPTGLHANTQPGHAEAWETLIPMARAGHADEISGSVVFLTGKDSTYVTGTEVVVDGGLSQAGLLTGRKRLMEEFQAKLTTNKPVDES